MGKTDSRPSHVFMHCQIPYIQMDNEQPSTSIHRHPTKQASHYFVLMAWQITCDQEGASSFGWTEIFCTFLGS